MQASRSVHVIAMPLLFLDGERHYCYICDCKDMRPGLNILRGMCSSATTKTGMLTVAEYCADVMHILPLQSHNVLAYRWQTCTRTFHLADRYPFCAAWDRAAKPCFHSQAAEVLHSQSERSAIYSMPDEALQRGLAADMELETDSVYIVNPSHGQDFLLSVASAEGSTSRVFVGATSRCKFRCHACASLNCQHCCGVQQWIEEEDGRTVELCDIFDSFSLHSQGHMDENPAQRCMPISTLKIPDNYISELLGVRGLGLGVRSLSTSCLHEYILARLQSFHEAPDSSLICFAGSSFPQASASRINSATVHLVPELGGHCHICSAPWACQDPVEAGWLKTTGTLYGMSGCAVASVYYRPCSKE